MKLYDLKIYLFFVLTSSSLSFSQYPYQTFQSFERPQQNLIYNQMGQSPRIQNYNKLQMPRISSNSFMSQVLIP